VTPRRPKMLQHMIYYDIMWQLMNEGELSTTLSRKDRAQEQVAKLQAI